MPVIPPRSPIAEAPISLLLLVPGDGGQLPTVLAAWSRVLTELSRPWEIVVVPLNPGLVEPADLQAATTGFCNTRVILESGPLGVGTALAAGLAQARYPLVCTAPGDVQFQPEELPRLLKDIDKVDLVTGYRLHQPVPAWLATLDWCQRAFLRVLLGDGRERRDCWLGWASWRRRWTARHLFGVPLKDPECPLRLYRREIFRRIPIQSKGSFAQVEILAKANHLGCLFSEIPVTWTPPRAAALVHDPGFAAEARRVFRAPDFGPPFLESPPASLSIPA